MSPVALFRGPCHVMEYATPEVIEISGRDGRGAPVREIYDDPKYADIQAAMDEAWRSGGFVKLTWPRGTLLIGPRIDERGLVFGVATYFRFAQQQVDSRPRPMRLLPHLPAGQVG